MIRLHIIAEGQTEQAFAKTVIAPHLACFDVFIDARCVLNSAEIPEYNKVTGGVSVARKIGLQKLRQRCRHFNEWLTDLEQLAAVKP